MAVTPDALINVAQLQVGYSESPANSNRTRFGEWYGMDGQPWCAIFVSWCFDQIGGLDAVGGKFAYTPSWVNWAKQNGCWLDREEKPQPGDLVFFHNSSRICHVGIVTKRNGTVSVSTIEGNTSSSSNDNGGRVQARVRTYGARGSSWWIAGFLRPKWPAQSSTPAAPSHPGNAGTAKPLLDVDGEWGRETTKALQRALGTTVDGYVSGQRTKYRRYWPSCLTSSWRFGTSGSSIMVKAMQRVCGADADGVAGPATCRALQARLGVSVDGVCGPNTVKALQRRLNSGGKL